MAIYYAQAYSLQASTSQSIPSVHQMTLKGYDIPVILAVHPAAQHSHMVPYTLLTEYTIQWYLTHNSFYVGSNVDVMLCVFQNVVLLFQITQHSVQNSLLMHKESMNHISLQAWRLYKVTHCREHTSTNTISCIS